MDRSITNDIELRVEEIAEEYLDQLHAGTAPDRAQVLAAHPEIADVLDDHLSVVERMYRAAHSSETESDTATAFGSSLLTRLPERIGRYQIRQVVGRGATGTVYRAYDPKFDREVALKVLRADTIANHEAAERFHREARIAAQLRHPYIVPLHETGEDNRHLYLDMAFVSGETLEARLGLGPMSFADAAGLIEKLAGALDYAHGQGIFHRDIKPANILLEKVDSSQQSVASRENASATDYGLRTTDYSPQLTDFGLARRAGAEASLTEHGQVIGTLSYMPPEQAKGGAHQADQRSDVYGLGAVLYRLLTGKAPFAGEGSLHSQVYHIVHDEPPKPRAINPAVPRDLETICLKAMAKEPADRFANAAAMADELRRWQKDESLTIRPPTWWEKTRRWARRNRAVARVTGVSGVLLFVTATAGVIYWRESVSQERAKAEVEYASYLFQARQLIATPTEGRGLEARAILRKVSETRSKLRSGMERDRFDLMARSLYAMSLSVPDFVGKEESGILPEVFWKIWPVAVHPSGRYMAIGTPSGPVRWDRASPCEFPDGVDPEAERPRIAFSHDGEYLALAPAAGGLRLYRGAVTGDQLAERLPIDIRRVLAIGFHPREPSLSVLCGDGMVRTVSLPELIEMRSWQTGLVSVAITAAAFTPDLSRVAIGDMDGNIRICSDNGTPMKLLPTSPNRMHVEALAWSPDARLLAIGRRDGNIELYENDTGIVQWRATAFEYGVSNLIFDPTGRWLLGGLRGTILRMWDVVSGRQVLTLDRYVPMGFSRDGRTLALSRQDRVAFAEFRAPMTMQPLAGHKAVVQHLVWSRNERFLVSLDAAYEMRVWDVKCATLIMSKEVPRSDPEFFASNSRVAITDDGTVVAYASAGTKVSHACMYEVPSGKLIGRPWDLEGGYETLACTGSGFVLVREEREPRIVGPRQSVVYDWAVGEQPCPRPGPALRPSEPGDQNGYFTSELTPDARYFLWNGPREPEHKRRLEVFDVVAGSLIRRFDRMDARGPNAGFSGHLSPDGRYLHAELGGVSYSVFELEAGIELVSERPPRFSENMDRKVYFPGPDKTFFLDRIRVLTHDREDTLVELFNLDSSNISGPTLCHLSPQGRYLAWHDWSGGITVADLPALEEAVESFARTHLPK